MIAFWDTSALLALILEETHTPTALVAHRMVTLNYAWDWLRIEAESGLLRRNASAASFKALATQIDSLRWLSVERRHYDAISTLNSRYRLRSADAGHLYCLQQATLTWPEIQLISFDRELIAAARAEKLRVWSP